ncbi:sensor histidine kinase [Bailinhaonella thermotolerans]|uniref:sensor histidine kinase n=1 Tax=Bailinhaonella thermotolerans TaxID=1070861 RepID=UPI001F5B050C|nr:histidine kinase [Bailinhaonella thermotolerans]
MMCGCAWVLRFAEQEEERRERTLEELSRTNRLLEASLAENARLHAQLLAQAREAGVLDERRRMAREIHDTLAQGLTGIIAQLQAAEQMHEVPAPWRRPFDAVKNLARESLTEARRSVEALRPEPLQAARLGDALAGVADRWSNLHGLPVQVTTTGTPRPMAPEAELALLRTAQEALANGRPGRLLQGTGQPTGRRSPPGRTAFAPGQKTEMWTWSQWFWVMLPRSLMGFQPPPWRKS